MYKRMAFALISASIVLTMSGCGMNTKNVKTNELKVRSTENRAILDENMYGNTNGNTNGNMNGNMNGTMNGNKNGNANGYNMGTKNVHVDAAENIQNSILKIKGVSAATVFVNNNDVVVGVDLKDNANKAEVEKQVKKAVEKSDKGYKVHVTSDKNMHTRIQDMKTQMVPMDGHPVRNMAKDVGILIEDIGKAITAPLR
ncbi:YhcN/YlaJ family sporulation lipoprotein [Paenibacillus endoradicis]|uniref:YhcN/YlaJ family sporulation lipoprotein n=1 Tax=Paenibacillus endoradicis TaxID=2972487 RepID=UPI002159190D|nr:YhcN/YlaJ family sporulation lipoprotein [Paenibacillus endoradicis]MCR8655848.1 YhcN/YlaJ family sporulation lipoprotein [Paenibacillus endoradicis]MCR8658174.1 YhcN/YlaJ family sporulation lipoprotein [Paenibacillus endoradicis]